MGIILPTGVANNLGTPGAITDSIINLPNALDIATGTLFIAPDVPALYTNDNGTWKSIASGGGGTNPTTYFLPVNNGGTFIDSVFIDDFSNGITKTLNRFLSVETGLSLNFANNYYSLGDTLNNHSGTSINADDTNYIVNTKWGGNEIGLNCNFNYQLFQLGDFNYTANGGYISFDNNNGFFSAFWANIENGLSLNFLTSIYLFGDFNGTVGDFRLKIDSNLGRYNLSSMPSYTDNAAALAAGLSVGDLYRHDGLLESADQLRIVH